MGRRLPFYVGAQREFRSEGSRLLQEANRVPKVSAVRLSIPADHPQAQALLELARALATRQELESGIQVRHVAAPGSDEKVLDLLRKIIGPDQVARILRDVGVKRLADDPIMGLGLGILRAAAGITGSPSAPLEDLLQEGSPG